MSKTILFFILCLMCTNLYSQEYPIFTKSSCWQVIYQNGPLNPDAQQVYSIPIIEPDTMFNGIGYKKIVSALVGVPSTNKQQSDCRWKEHLQRLNVTSTLPQGYVDLTSIGNLEYKSHNYVLLESGFKAEPLPGGVFLAHVDPSYCSTIDRNNSARQNGSLSVYHPLLEHPKFYLVYPPGLEGTGVRKIEDIGDTILNGLSYTIINTTVISFSGLQNTNPFIYDTGNVYMREDIISKQIFIRTNSGTDTLWYDFGLNVGDAFPGIPQLLLTTIDSVQMLNGNYNNRFIFTFLNDSVIWIEGIGSISHPLWPFTWFTIPGINLICAYQNDTLLYDAGSLYNFSCTTLTTALNEQQQAGVNPFSVYPNPFNNSFTTVINLDRETAIDLVVYDAMGKAVEVLVKNKKYSAGKHEIQCEKKLTAGVYLVKLTAGDKSHLQKICKTE